MKGSVFHFKDTGASVKEGDDFNLVCIPLAGKDYGL